MDGWMGKVMKRKQKEEKERKNKRKKKEKGSKIEKNSVRKDETRTYPNRRDTSIPTGFEKERKDHLAAGFEKD